VMAAVMKFERKYSIRIIPSKLSSRASVRDKLVACSSPPALSAIPQGGAAIPVPEADARGGVTCG
jgi:hypothetical protein